MALKLEDIINKKKEPGQILDLSKIKIKTKEEFEKYYDKIPEFKIRPEKVRPDDIKIRDADYSFSTNRKEIRGKPIREFIYSDPIPPTMRSVRLEDLAAVDINWRMLTVCRPASKLEEEIFSRLVELGKLRISTRKHEAKLVSSTSLGLPAAQAQLISLGIVTTKTKRGTSEVKIKTCRECGEEMCNGKWCKEFSYEAYTRMIMDKDELANEEAEELGLKKQPQNSITKIKKKKKTLKTKIKKGKRKRKKKTPKSKKVEENLDESKDTDSI